MRILRNMIASVGGLVWPDTCAGCGTQEETVDSFCARCSREMLALVASDYCPRCGTGLGPGLTPGADGCFACPRVMFRFDQVIRLGVFAGPLRQAVHQAKYRRHSVLATHLVDMLADGVRARCQTRLDLVLPVPMHWRRRLYRGHNHAQGLAAGLASRLGLPMGDELVRVRHTPPQVNLAASSRARNVHGAFAVFDAKPIAGARVLLVDDVMTTGATVNEATRVLLEAGAAGVVVAVLARARTPRAYEHAADPV